MEPEIEALERVLRHPARPFAAVVGGAKVTDKFSVLRSLAERANHLLLGGAQCFTFLAALGHDVGASHVEPTLLDEARFLLTAHPRIMLPTDFVALGADAKPGATEGIIQSTGVDLTPSCQGMDIGPGTRVAFSSEIARAGTVL